MKSILNNALFHFIVIGIALFMAYTYFLADQRGQILLDQQTIETIIKADQEITQQELTEERKTSLIENFIDEEVLLREAYARELYKNDYRVRKRLLGLMRSSITEVIPEPSMAQLRAYYDENQEKFKVDEALSFEMVRFPFNSETLPEDPERFIEALEASSNPIEFSEIDSFGNMSLDLGYQEIAMQYGKDMADVSFKATFNTWQGPVSTRNEVVYFRVIEKHEAYLPEFESIESYLRNDYYLTTTRSLQQEKIKALRDQYQITIEAN